MLYLTSVLVAAAGVVVLLFLLVRLSGAARRLSETLRLCRGYFADRTGTLRARISALRVALTERGHRGTRSSRAAPAA